MPNKSRFFVLTGPPGIGKTSIVQSIWPKLLETKITAKGFYTEEVRINGERIGFDAVPLQDVSLRKPLARVPQDNLPKPRGPMIGKYMVDVHSFEQLTLPLLEIEPKVMYIIDEIGKMELLSNKFAKAVEKLMTETEIIILATIPLKVSIPLVNNLRNNSSTELFVVNKSNRDKLPEEIFNKINNSSKSFKTILQE